MGLTYDNWKLQTPDEDEKENSCMYCGEPTDNKHYCSKECQKADYYD